MAGNADTVQPDDTANADAEGYDFAQALDDQLCVPCILCNCQGCDACISYGVWTPGNQECTCNGSGF